MSNLQAHSSQEALASSERPALSWLDRVAFQRLVENDPKLWQELVGEVTALAGSLSNPAERDEARVRLLARAIAAERTRQIIYTDRLDEYLRHRDVLAVELLERTLLRTTRRLVSLMAEHRRACETLPRRVSIAVGNAQNVMVAAGR